MPVVQPATRMFCLPFAGGSAATYNGLQRHLNRTDVCASELPGRGTRIRERAIENLDELIGQLRVQIELLDDVPIAFFGHSLGGALAFELALQLNCARRSPMWAVVLAIPSPAAHASRGSL